MNASQLQTPNGHHKQELEDALKKQEHSLAGFFVRKYRITYLILAVFALFGFYAIATLPKEAEPEVEVPFAVVTVIYPGANPTDVEELVIDKIEDKITSLDKLKRVESTSGVGIGSISVEFEAEANLEKSIDELKDAVDEAKADLPDDAEEPVVQDINFNDIPIVTYSFSGPYSDAELKEYADVLQASFENLPDVSRAPVIGGIEQEFQILVDKNKLAAAGVSLQQVVDAVRISNNNIPAGEIDVGDYTYSVRVKGKFENVADISQVVVAQADGVSLYVGDIALVRDDFKERKTKSKIGIGDQQSSNTVSVQIHKTTGGNILRITQNAQEAIATLQERGTFPADLSIVKTNDNSVFIKEDISRLGKSGLQTTILIVIILFAVLGFRGALITGLSVPVAFLMSFIIIMIQGMTINSMVLFSLVLSLGLMVDNAIIVMEGINEYRELHGKTPYEAAMLSIWNYKWPIIAGTMTTVGAFLPMLLVSGIMGEYMSILPKTITATLLSSLLVAIVIIPALSARFLKKEKAEEKATGQFHKKLFGLLNGTKERYVPFMRRILSSRKARRSVIGLAIALFLFTVSLPVVGIMKIEMFPQVDFDYFVVNVELPVGSSLEKTEEIVTKAEGIVREIDELDNYVINIGQGFSTDPGSSGSAGTHLGSLVANLHPKEKRSRKSYEVVDSVRDALEAIDGGIVKVEELNAGPPTGAPIEARIYGDDLDALIGIGNEVKDRLSKIDGVINIADNVDESSGEFVFSVDRRKAQHFGVSVGAVANAIRQAVHGAQATTVRIAGDDVDVTVMYDKTQLQDAESLGNITLPGRSGAQAVVRQVANLSLEPSVFRIAHRDGQKVVKVTASVDRGADLRSIVRTFESSIDQITLSGQNRIDVGGEREDIEQSFTEIFASMIVAVFLILFILVLQFNSFKKPFIILFSLPLAIVGAFVGLTVLRLPFSLPAFIGIVSLSGIVVNDAIVLVDRIEKNLRRKMLFVDAIVEAGVARMQPILLTSITTIAGVFPLAISQELWRGLGFSIIFGLLFATILTLVFVPILYVVFSKKEYEKNLLHSA